MAIDPTNPYAKKLKGGTEHMPGSKKTTSKTGVTHYPLDEERENQQRVPPRGEAKEPRSATSQSLENQVAPGPALTPAEERTISRQGAKGGKSSGSRAGLVSSSKKTRRS